MNPRDSGPTRNSSPGNRAYEDMPSVTSRAWGPQHPHEDRFGHDGPSGYGDIRERSDRQHQAAGTGQRAGHRGRGPRGAARGDHLIAEEINERLMHDEQVDASEILLAVEDGVVTLTGEVPERRMKHRAEDIAASVRGVRELRNVIRVDNGEKSFGPAGREARSGDSQKGSGFSSASPGHAVGNQGTRTD